MNKIGLITFQRAYNYGGTLQAYATQEFLKKEGFEIDIIDYWPYYWSKNTFKSSIKDILLYRKKKKFTDFQEKKLNLTKQVSTLKEVSELAQNYSTLIVGSDQVWNPNITGNRFDEVFFLNFSHPNKLSYASSLGSYKFSEEEIVKLKSVFSTYKAISTREKISSNYLSSLIERDVDTVLDPTLLLDKKAWENFATEDAIIKNKYLLVYNLGKDKNVFKIAETCGEKLDLKIINLGRSFRKSYKDLNNLGPKEFVNLIYHADFIVTNSFHGTAFATNMNKEFYSIVNSHSPERARDFLANVTLKNRLIDSDKDLSFDKIDYSITSKKLEELREYSKQYLRHYL